MSTPWPLKNWAVAETTCLSGHSNAIGLGVRNGEGGDRVRRCLHPGTPVDGLKCQRRYRLGDGTRLPKKVEGGRPKATTWAVAIGFTASWRRSIETRGR